jgi:hypothetical protein
VPLSSGLGAACYDGAEVPCLGLRVMTTFRSFCSGWWRSGDDGECLLWGSSVAARVSLVAVSPEGSFVLVFPVLFCCCFSIGRLLYGY